MNKREKILGVVILGLVGLFLADRFILAPVLAAFDEVATQTDQAREQLGEARALVDSQRTIDARWSAYRRAALPNNDPDAALQLITRWALDAGLSVDTYTSGRQLQGERFDQKLFSFNAKGNMTSVEAFLWSLRTAPIPLRIESLSLTSRDENKDELALTLTLTTILEPTGEAR